MELIPTWLWFVSGLVFLVVELNTVTFFFGIVGVGALFASLTDLFFVSEIPSFITFILGSSLVAYLAWKFNIYSESASGIRTGADRLIGKTGIVEEKINPSRGTGIVTVEGEKWRAKSRDERTIAEESEVTIMEIDGTTLVVRQSSQIDEQNEEVDE